MNGKTYWPGLLPVLFSFFVMGFVDVVGISVSHIQSDFNLSESTAGIIPSMVFIWFAVFSIPVGLLMNRIGRRNTVILSAVVTLLAMLLPKLIYSYSAVLIAFALLGIGNTILQVSLNPLMMNVVPSEKITSMLTLGQFVKAISSTLGPVIVAALSGYLGDWKLVFPVYAFLTAVSLIWIWCVKIDESESKVSTSGFKDVIPLFKEGYLIMMFSVIVLIVGFEIGLMTYSPKILMEKCNISLEEAGLGNTLYYVARTIGTFLGAFILSRVSSKKFLTVTLTFALLAIVLYMRAQNLQLFLVILFVIGLMCANVFAIAYSSALQFKPEKANEISALMIMGVAGGALISPIIGAVSDATGQIMAGMAVLVVAIAYMFIVSLKLK